MRLAIRVIPRSSKNGTDGIRDGRLLVRVTAPPVDSAANEAVVRTLADALNVPRRGIRIVNGATSRNKLVEIDGLTESDVHARLAAH